MEIFLYCKAKRNAMQKASHSLVRMTGLVARETSVIAKRQLHKCRLQTKFADNVRIVAESVNEKKDATTVVTPSKRCGGVVAGVFIRAWTDNNTSVAR